MEADGGALRRFLWDGRRRKCSVCVPLRLAEVSSCGSSLLLSVKDPESSSHLQSMNLFPNSPAEQVCVCVCVCVGGTRKTGHRL